MSVKCFDENIRRTGEAKLGRRWEGCNSGAAMAWVRLSGPKPNPGLSLDEP